MKLMKENITVVIDNPDVIAGYIDSGYAAVREAAKPKAAGKTVSKKTNGGKDPCGNC